VVIRRFAISTWLVQVVGIVFTLMPRAHAEEIATVLREIPFVPENPKRLIAIDDLLRLRDIDSLNLSPDGSHFAILVRQAVPEQNTYRTGWFVGSSTGGDLTFVGGGGDVRLLTLPDGTTGGEIAGGPGRWSPDGKWLAYPVKRNNEVQLWRSRSDGRVVEQLTHNSADVRDFAWSEDGRIVYFTAGTPHAELKARDQAEAWRGYRFDDFRSVSEITTPGHPPRPLEDNPPVWVVDLEAARERNANAEESKSFERLRSVSYMAGAGGAELPKILNGAEARPALSSKGTLAWLARTGDRSSIGLELLRVTVSKSADGSHPIPCLAPECSGLFIDTVWWSADANRVMFWNLGGNTGMEVALYAWSPSTGKISILVRPGDVFRGCAMATNRLICLRETVVQPAHVVAIDTRSGAVKVIADVNPELKNIRFGKVQRFEWDVPSAVPNLYPQRSFGYIVYPPDFDATRKYPVFIAPYSASGFQRGDVGDEHPLFAYAASGILVIHASYPFEIQLHKTSAEVEKFLFSPERGFPYLTTMLESTLRALDVVSKRGIVDEKHVGIGGVSQASGNPLYMLWKEDRIAAASVAGGYLGPWMYYWWTPRGHPRSDEWYPATSVEGLKWWNPIDVAQHVDKIRSPILFNISDQEIGADATLLRHLEDARKPFDAYVFPGEYHEKWQPAHRHAIYERNLDWFRFWLQDYEDPDPTKAEQYKRWHELRKLQVAQDAERVNTDKEQSRVH